MISKTIARAATVTIGAALAFTMQPAAAQSLDELPIITMYKFVPGKYEEAVRMLAEQDKILAEAGLPAIEYYFHRQGAGWHMVMITKPEPEDYAERFKAAREKLGIERPERGAFISMVADHFDIVVLGPTTAAELVEKMDAAE